VFRKNRATFLLIVFFLSTGIFTPVFVFLKFIDHARLNTVFNIIILGLQEAKECYPQQQRFGFWFHILRALAVVDPVKLILLLKF
jgi:hypothetical protein